MKAVFSTNQFFVNFLNICCLAGFVLDGKLRPIDFQGKLYPMV
jgi:hypothetical protein